MQLGFSNSIPGPRLLQEQILHEPDIGMFPLSIWIHFFIRD